MAALLITKENKIGVELAITSPDAKSIFHDLAAQKGQIEAKIGASLEWREMADKKSSRIILFLSADAYDENDWPRQFAWLKATLGKFDEAFRLLVSNKVGV